MKKEQLFEALSEVGDDLVLMAEQMRFVSPWRKWAQTAAILAVVVCFGVLVLPYFPVGCGSTQETAAMLTTDSAVEETEEYVAEESAVCEEEFDECKEETPCECVDEIKVPDLSVSDSIDEGAAVTLDDVRRAVAEENFDWLAETFVQPMEESLVKVFEAVTEEDWLFLLISLPDQKGVTKEYIIRFEENGWYYETVNEIMPDGTLHKQIQ